MFVETETYKTYFSLFFICSKLSTKAFENIKGKTISFGKLKAPYAEVGKRNLMWILQPQVIQRSHAIGCQNS